MTAPGLIVIDDYLGIEGGHILEYCRCLCQSAEAHGISSLALGYSKAPASVVRGLPYVRAFRHMGWDKVSPVDFARPAVDSVLINLLFFLDLRRSVKKLALQPGSVAFMPDVTHRQLFGFLAWLCSMPRSRRPRAALLFRFTMRDPSVSETAWLPVTRLLRAGFRLLERYAARNPVVLLTDSESLRREYRELTSLPMQVVPIPHTRMLEASASSAEPRAVHFLMPGEARDDKGFPTLVSALERLAPVLREGRVRITLSTFIRLHQEASVVARQRLERLGLPNVTLIEHETETEEYYRILSTADVLLLPYRRARYAAQTSGILCEALAAGKPAIVTEGTWMSEQVVQHGAGLVVPDADPDALAAAIREAADDYARLLEKARSAQAAWLSYHNVDNLLRAVVGDL